jgi:hypothetical protein
MTQRLQRLLVTGYLKANRTLLFLRKTLVMDRQQCQPLSNNFWDLSRG